MRLQLEILKLYSRS